MKIRIRKPKKHSRYVPKPRYPYPEHTGFWLSENVHVYGDPNMSAETATALLELAKCAAQAIERGEIEKLDKE